MGDWAESSRYCETLTSEAARTAALILGVAATGLRFFFLAAAGNEAGVRKKAQAKIRVMKQGSARRTTLGYRAGEWRFGVAQFVAVQRQADLLGESDSDDL